MRNITDSNVCVVGGAGFLGSHLVDYLVNEKNCNVLVIDNLISGRREFVNPKAKFEHADITQSENFLYLMFKRHNIDYVFNYAAEPYIPVSFERPLHVFNTNAVGALHVINAAQSAKCKGILQISSAEIYGDAITGGTNGGTVSWTGNISESYPVTPHSSYGAAKAAIDAMVQVRWKEAKTPCIALRQFNCVGERETHPYIVPEIISQLSKWKKPAGSPLGEGIEYIPSVKLGNNSFRDFLYAGDQVRMAVELLEKGEFGEVYNLGSENGFKMYGLAKVIGELMGFTSVDVEVDESRKRPWEIWHLRSDNTKVYNTIKSRPEVYLSEALRRTIVYFVNSGNKWCWE